MVIWSVWLPALTDVKVAGVYCQLPPSRVTMAPEGWEVTWMFPFDGDRVQGRVQVHGLAFRGPRGYRPGEDLVTGFLDGERPEGHDGGRDLGVAGPPGDGASRGEIVKGDRGTVHVAVHPDPALVAAKTGDGSGGDRDERWLRSRPGCRDGGDRYLLQRCIDRSLLAGTDRLFGLVRLIAVHRDLGWNGYRRPVPCR